jgi:hypothetical protein
MKTGTLNNAWKNLRQATTSQNQYNRSMPKNNTTGLKGVSRNGKKWVVQVGRNYIGIYDTAEEASRVYLETVKRVAGPFASNVKMKEEKL